MPELHRVPTQDLVDELVSRASTRWRESKPIPLCDECAHFVPYQGDPDGMPKNYNPCGQRHEMRFRVPDSFDDINTGNWGFYRRGCKDRQLLGEKP